jgi:hypothetical protein
MDNKEDWIGRKVEKHSHKPFKSQRWVNTVKGVIPHPMRPNCFAFTFEEDDSYVSVEMCKLQEIE